MNVNDGTKMCPTCLSAANASTLKAVEVLRGELATKLHESNVRWAGLADAASNAIDELAAKLAEVASERDGLRAALISSQEECNKALAELIELRAGRKP